MRTLLHLVLFAVLIAAAPPPTLAQAGAAPGATQSSSGRLSIIDAMQQVLERYEGDVVEAELKPGRPHEMTHTVYELRLLTPRGNMLRIRVDAANGDILEVDGRGLVDARRRQ